MSSASSLIKKPAVSNTRVVPDTGIDQYPFVLAVHVQFTCVECDPFKLAYMTFVVSLQLHSANALAMVTVIIEAAEV